jgi:hypothetical protein
VLAICLSAATLLKDEVAVSLVSVVVMANATPYAGAGYTLPPPAPMQLVEATPPPNYPPPCWARLFREIDEVCARIEDVGQLVGDTRHGVQVVNTRVMSIERRIIGLEQDMDVVLRRLDTMITRLPPPADRG